MRRWNWCANSILRVRNTIGSCITPICLRGSLWILRKLSAIWNPICLTTCRSIAVHIFDGGKVLLKQYRESFGGMKKKAESCWNILEIHGMKKRNNTIYSIFYIDILYILYYTETVLIFVFLRKQICIRICFCITAGRNLLE